MEQQRVGDGGDPGRIQHPLYNHFQAWIVREQTDLLSAECVEQHGTDNKDGVGAAPTFGEGGRRTALLKAPPLLMPVDLI